MEELVLQLSKPVMHGTKEITELRFREPTAKDLIDMQKGANAHEQNLLLLSSLSAVPSAVLARMPVRDFIQAVRLIDPFFQDAMAD